MDDDSFLFNCLLVIAVLVVFGFAAEKIAHAFVAAHQYVLYPTYRFVLTYMDQFGRATAEVICLLGVAWLGPRFHRQVISEVSRSFTETIQKVEDERNQYREKLGQEIGKVKGLLYEREGAEKELSRLRKQREALESEIEGLHLEVERLAEPEKVAEREEVEARAEATKELLEHVDQTQWRSLG
jgi:hypothetical protein